ncbi:MAG: PAS domain-containing protein, partial [Acidimicrobiia bacterium]|nr:PAS domain-containing protein [Acidimicrobiia bacterium]
MNGNQGAIVAGQTDAVFGPTFSTSPQPMAVYDHLVRLVAANPAYLAFTRESLEQLVGRTPDDRRYSFADGGDRLVELVAGRADSCQTELEIHRADGTSAAATVTGHAVRHDGELTHIGLRL